MCLKFSTPHDAGLLTPFCREAAGISREAAVLDVVVGVVLVVDVQAVVVVHVVVVQHVLVGVVLEVHVGVVPSAYVMGAQNG